MSFHDFMQSIVAPDLRRVAQHWETARGARPLPGWGNIRPSQIAEQLPIIWVYKYDRDADAFIARLAGDQIERIFKQSFRGTPMSKLYPPNEYPRLFARSKRVVEEPALFRGDGMVFRHVDHFGHGERIIMPLADDGETGDGILGATVYSSVRGTPAANLVEKEEWFPL